MRVVITFIFDREMQVAGSIRALFVNFCHALYTHCKIYIKDVCYSFDMPFKVLLTTISQMILFPRTASSTCASLKERNRR